MGLYNLSVFDAFTYKIEYETDNGTGQVVATIPELNYISSFGDSFAETQVNIQEAALGYLEVMSRLNLDINKE